MTDPAEKTVLVLQGGGALGAYQAGAYAALCDAGHMPSWVAGISIGAVNSAIIAGNPPERRVERSSSPTRRLNMCWSEPGRARTWSSSRSTCSAPEDACRRRCSISRSGKRRFAIRAAPGSTPTSSARCRRSAGPSAICGGGCRKSCATGPDWQLLDSVSCDAAVTILLLIHRRAAYWTQSNDYEFSRYSMDEHWLAGAEDVEHSFNHPDWRNRTRPEEGVKVLDLTRDIDTDPKERVI